MGGAAPCEVGEVTTGEGLEALSPEWDALWERCPHATPFQSPAWVLPWWRRLGCGRLWVLTLRRGGRLVGLAPLCVSRYYGTPLRRVCILGTGNTDYLDLLLEPEAAELGTRLLLDHLARERRRWDFCDFQQLRADSPLLHTAMPAGLRAEIRTQETCPVLSLSGRGEGVEEWLSPRMAANLRYSRRRLAREGGRLETADADTLGETLDALYRLHAARWNRRHLTGAFAGRRTREFHREAAAALLERGWLRLYGLRLEGDLCAVLYCFLCGGRAYYYSGGFDPAIGALSPGTLLTAHAIDDALRNGAAEFDFLRGDEAYKYRWGAGDTWNSRLLLWGPGSIGALAPHLVRCERGVERVAKSVARRLSGTGRGSVAPPRG